MKKAFLICILALCLAGSALAGSALAQESAITETPVILTEAEKAIVDVLEPAIIDVEQAKEKVEAVIEAARNGKASDKDVADAEQDLATKEKQLDASRVQALSQQSGLSEAEIQAMRDSGKGWGVIAKEAGVHPSALGKGQGKSKAAKMKNKKNKNMTDTEELDDDLSESSVQSESGKKNKAKKNKGKKK